MSPGRLAATGEVGDATAQRAEAAGAFGAGRQRAPAGAFRFQRRAGDGAAIGAVMAGATARTHDLTHAIRASAPTTAAWAKMKANSVPTAMQAATLAFSPSVMGQSAKR